MILINHGIMLALDFMKLEIIPNEINPVVEMVLSVFHTVTCHVL
jgi:hypothetical protein